jgi:hypothetical protein
VEKNQVVWQKASSFDKDVVDLLCVFFGKSKWSGSLMPGVIPDNNAEPVNPRQGTACNSRNPQNENED